MGTVQPGVVVLVRFPFSVMRHSLSPLFVSALLGAGVPSSGSDQPPLQTRYTQILPLAREEGVFAYSRISPDGNYLSYASERHRGQAVVPMVNFIDLRSRKVLHSEPGFDSYWAPDGKRVIFLSVPDADQRDVSMWHRDSGKVVRNVAPANLGAYFTWARAGGRDLILTQRNHYYFLQGDRALRPYWKVLPCPGIGTGEQPMISRDGRLIATFVTGTLAIRSLEGCDTVVETNLPGGKADFSWDGRFVAFHTPKEGGDSAGYQIIVVDLKARTMIHVTDLPGSSYYPSWTEDGRLSFRYDSEEYRGFMMASDFLGNPVEPLCPTPAAAVEPGTPGLRDLFPASEQPRQRVVIVNFWAAWCVHCRTELPILNRIRGRLRAKGLDAEIVAACEPSSQPSDRAHVVQAEGIGLPQLQVSTADLERFGIQMFPTSLMFVDGRLRERRYGTQSQKEFATWLSREGVSVKF